MVVHTIIPDQSVIFSLKTPMNFTTRMVSVDGGGLGLSFWSLVNPIGQQLTSTAAAATAAMHVI